MVQKECIAMVLAGGKGARLGALTKDVAKPSIHFGGKYRIIDFTLSNCKHSEIDTIGILTQYRPFELHLYIGDGRAWGLDGPGGGVHFLPSYETGGKYTGTANAVYRNIKFIEEFNPEYVLILSGDHIYKMDYGKMLDFHKKNNADATVAVTSVTWEEASRFGVLNVAEDGLITEFSEKPQKPKSNLASMGIYIFKWSRLKKYLKVDEDYAASEHDFGQNIVPSMLLTAERMYAYKFRGYWKDVGTVESLWEANMDLIREFPKINLYDDKWEIFTPPRRYPPCCMSGNVEIKRSIISEGCRIRGRVENSVLFDYVNVGDGAEIVDSVIMPGVSIGRNAKIYKAIIGTNSLIGENAEIGSDNGIDVFYDAEICSKNITLIGPGVYVDKNIKIGRNSHIDGGLLSRRERQPSAAARESSVNRKKAKLELVTV